MVERESMKDQVVMRLWERSSDARVEGKIGHLECKDSTSEILLFFRINFCKARSWESGLMSERRVKSLFSTDRVVKVEGREAREMSSGRWVSSLLESVSAATVEKKERMVVMSAQLSSVDSRLRVLTLPNARVKWCRSAAENRVIRRSRFPLWKFCQ
jgi:uncharacterized protein (DUF1501 family)